MATEDLGPNPPEEERRADSVPSVDPRPIADALADVTADGMFPLVAYGLDWDKPTKLLLVTSSIPDMVLAQEMLRRFLGEDYNLGRYVIWPKLESFAVAHRTLVRMREVEIPGFVSSAHYRLVGNLARDQAASRWKQKGFGLVDICGFSLCSIEEQLAHRTSLALALSQASSRVHKLYQAHYLSGRATFCSASTGDGFYFWHRSPGGANDVAVFMLLIYVMTQAEAMRAGRRAGMRLRGGFAIGEAYTFPSRELETIGYDAPPMQDAIGPVLNSLARMLTAAKPGQIVMGDFSRPGRAEKEETLTPGRLIDQAKRQLLPAELAPTDPVTPMDIDLAFAPNQRLRLEDKHGVVHYCYNLVGAAPNRFKGENVRVQQIGLAPEQTLHISDVAFADPSSGA